MYFLFNQENQISAGILGPELAAIIYHDFHRLFAELIAIFYFMHVNVCV